MADTVTLQEVYNVTGSSENQVFRFKDATDVMIDGDMEMTRNNGGPILRSPDGTRYKMSVSDAGQLVITRT